MKILLGLFVSIAGYSASFENKTEFQPFKYTGWVTAHCLSDDPYGTETHFCTEHVLKPSSFLYFTHSTDKLNATKVTLISKDENNEEIVKTKLFDPNKGRTKTEVNLWADSVLSRALLNVGENEITYILKDSKKNVLEQGSFKVFVNQIIEKRCRPGIVFATHPGSCTNQFEMCGKYINDSNCK